MTTKEKDKLNKKNSALQSLEEYRGNKVCACVKSVARSGMSRRIEFYALFIDNKKKAGITRIGYLIARALGRSYDVDKGGLQESGCGMDMVFHVLSSLNYVYAQWKHPGKTLKEIVDMGTYGERIYDTALFNANDYVSL